MRDLHECREITTLEEQPGSESTLNHQRTVRRVLGITGTDLSVQGLESVDQVSSELIGEVLKT